MEEGDLSYDISLLDIFDLSFAAFQWQPGKKDR
jgi:hypothetical protein